MDANVLCIVVLRITTELRVKILNPTVVYANDGSKAVVLMLFPILCGFMVFATGCFMLSSAFLFVLVFSLVLFSIVIISLVEERVYVLIVHLFVYFARVNVCPFFFLFVSGVGCGLWLWQYLDFSLNCFCIWCVHPFSGIIQLYSSALRLLSSTGFFSPWDCYSAKPETDIRTSISNFKQLERPFKLSFCDCQHGDINLWLFLLSTD